MLDLRAENGRLKMENDGGWGEKKGIKMAQKRVKCSEVFMYF